MDELLLAGLVVIVLAVLLSLVEGRLRRDATHSAQDADDADTQAW